MYITLSIKDVLFNGHTKAVLIKDNRVVLLKNISNKYLGWPKSEIVAFHPGMHMIDFKKTVLVDLLIQTGRRLAQDLPGLSILEPDLDSINFYTLHLHSESFVKYFKTIDQFLSFLKEAFKKITGVQPTLAVGENPFLNSVLLCLTDDSFIDINKSNTYKILNSLHPKNCFFLTEQDKTKLFHLRINTLKELLDLADSSNFGKVLSHKAQYFLTNLIKPSQQTVYKLEPLVLSSTSFLQEIHDINQLNSALIDLITNLKNKLEDKAETASKALLFFKSASDCGSQIIPIPHTLKELKAILPSIAENIYRLLKPPILEVNALPVDTTPKTYTPKSLFNLNTSADLGTILNCPSFMHSISAACTGQIRPVKLIQSYNLQKAHITNLVTPEKSYTYTDLINDLISKAETRARPRLKKHSNSLFNPISDLYPPILFHRLIPVICVRIPEDQIKYLIVRGKKIKIIASFPHCNINPEWWHATLSPQTNPFKAASYTGNDTGNIEPNDFKNLHREPFLTDSEKVTTEERRYYKALTRSGVLLWLVEINSHFYIQGVWA